MIEWQSASGSKLEGYPTHDTITDHKSWSKGIKGILVEI